MATAETRGDLSGAERLLRETAGDRVQAGFPLAPLTSFRIGGPASLYLEVESADDLGAVARAVIEESVPFVVIGKGSNLLVSDEGFPGLVVRLGRSYRWAAREGDLLKSGGSMPLPALAGVALNHGLSGLEFGVAIPASVGGSVWMNAGAHGHSLDEVLDSIELFDLKAGELRVIPASQAGFDYRKSELPDPGVVVAAGFLLEPRDLEEIRGQMEEARAWRKATQPLAEPNCGSVFKNPPGDHAARLIEEAGGKGLSVGGARVSEKHSNFIVANPGASAADVRALMEVLRDRVLSKFAVELEAEVRMVGPVS
ncbi:MAG: UDP-N-acetylmuramate dehydrogenase [Actinomycetota bacterium]